MSAKKRRHKAKIARLVRLDENHRRLYVMTSKRRDGERAAKLWWECIVPLGDKLGARAWMSLRRCDEGRDGLIQNYRKRVGA